MSFAITEQENILHIKLTGHISNDDLLALDKVLFDEWEGKGIVGHIYDYLETTTFAFSDDQMKSLAIIDTNESFISGALKIAIVATDPDILHFSRLYQENMKRSDWEVSIFSTVEEGMVFCLNSD